MTDQFAAAARALAATDRGVVSLTGAGVSLASGIPTFRSDDGLWNRYDPVEYGHIEAFKRDPEKVWRMLFDLDEILEQARPNAAHRAIAELEQLGVVTHVLTQNADGLHQRAGSTHVVELHGSNRTLVCLTCDHRRTREEVRGTLTARTAPRCTTCEEVLKPDAVFFGEPLPRQALRDAHDAVERCSTLLVVGTSAEVYPVADLPQLARDAGATIVEVNPEPVLAADHRLAGPAEQLLPQLVARIRDTEPHHEEPR